ncbi:hypothetical protein CYMTET_22028, partial [Cymbomonas tetramitiformis]
MPKSFSIKPPAVAARRSKKNVSAITKTEKKQNKSLWRYFGGRVNNCIAVICALVLVFILLDVQDVYGQLAANRRIIWNTAKEHVAGVTARATNSSLIKTTEKLDEEF